MKKIIYIASIALGLCACDNTEEILNTPETTKSSVVYHFSLQASLDAQTRGVTFDGESTISSQFEGTDKIYVYNETKGAFARSSNDQKLSYLQPKDGSISNNGVSCTLVGDLTFYKLNDSDKWEEVTVDATDTYSLYYQMNDPNYSFTWGVTVLIPRFDYSQQNGSKAGASICDFAEATGITMTLSGNTLTVPNLIFFSNLQSMFRQRLSFTKGGSSVTPSTITKLTVGTKNSTLLEYYRPDRPDQDGDNGKYWAFDSYDIDDPVITSDGDIYLSLAFYYTNDNPATGDQLILTAVDDEGNVYQGTKDVPTGGFQKSMYYYGSCEMVWQYQLAQNVMPTVTRSDGGDEDELDPYNTGLFSFADDPNPAKVTISGNSTGYYFDFEGSAEVTLTGGGTANLDNDDVNFIYATGDLTIVLGSDYTINCPNYDPAIYCKGNLKFKTTGNVQTLTVTTNEDEDSGYFGICGWTNYNNLDQTALSNLAVDGFTISRSDMTDNGDGTYTWVYTVKKND